MNINELQRKTISSQYFIEWRETWDGKTEPPFEIRKYWETVIRPNMILHAEETFRKIEQAKDAIK
jgi:hypothetical protein